MTTRTLYSIIAGIAMLASSQLFASGDDPAKNCIHCYDSHKNTPTEDTGLHALGQSLPYTDMQYEKLSKKVCRDIRGYYDDPTNYPVDRDYCKFIPGHCAKNTENHNHRSMIRVEVAKRLGIKTKDQLEDELPTILNKLSTYSCKRYKDPTFEQRPLNFMKVAAISDQFSDFYDNFIYKDYVKDGKLLVDLNAVEYVNGQPETLIDFFDKVISDTGYYKITKSQRRRFETLRRSLIENGAKRYSELH